MHFVNGEYILWGVSPPHHYPFLNSPSQGGTRLDTAAGLYSIFPRRSTIDQTVFNIFSNSIARNLHFVVNADRQL
eukprot:3406748-Pleurochrysis_carterae.AAC.1